MADEEKNTLKKKNNADSQKANSSSGEGATSRITKWLNAIKAILEHPVYVIAGVVLTFFLTLITFAFDVFPETTTDRWKSKIEGFFSKDPTKIDVPQKNYIGSDKLFISYPDLSGKNDSIEKIIVNKVISYLEKDNIGEFKRYNDLVYFLERYQTINPDSTFNMDIYIHQDTENGLSKYLYLSFLRSESPTKKDTVSLDFISFDLETNQEIKLNELFLGVSILKQIVEEGFSKNAKIEECFIDGFFHLSPNFVLKNDKIEFHYYHEKKGNWQPRSSLKLSIPYQLLQSQINFDSKLRFLRDKTS